MRPAWCRNRCSSMTPGSAAVLTFRRLAVSRSYFRTLRADESGPFARLPHSWRLQWCSSRPAPLWSRCKGRPLPVVSHPGHGSPFHIPSEAVAVDRLLSPSRILLDGFLHFLGTELLPPGRIVVKQKHELGHDGSPYRTRV